MLPPPNFATKYKLLFLLCFIRVGPALFVKFLGLNQIRVGGGRMGAEVNITLDDIK